MCVSEQLEEAGGLPGLYSWTLIPSAAGFLLPGAPCRPTAAHPALALSPGLRAATNTRSV